VTALIIIGSFFSFFLSTADPYRMRVFCYNVLAEVYAIPERHCYCPSWAIEWDYRKKLVLQEISKHNPDILCLQEVYTVVSSAFAFN